MPSVQLLSHTPSPEQLVAAAAKLCYSKTGADKLMEGLDHQKAAAFLARLEDLGHQSPLEHVSFTFSIEGVSRAFLAQITRHRIASYSVQSQRYVDLDHFEYIIPAEIASSPEAKEAFEEAMDQARGHYKKLAGILTGHHYEKLVAEGEDEKKAISKARKLANEDARFVLPNASETKMVVTMNARSLLNFFSLRCCTRAQWEIRAVADEMLLLVKAVAPGLFRWAGPPCVRGACPVGAMSCGKLQEMRRKYRD